VGEVGASMSSKTVTLIFVVILVLLLLLACIGYFTGNWNEDESARPGYQMASAESQPYVCVDPAMRETIRTIMADALDEALKAHVERMFEVWMKDDRGQPERAKTGVQNGISAYVKASKAVAEWAPPTCPG
jgi:hypothetical protein